MRRGFRKSAARVALLSLAVGPAVAIALLTGRLASESGPVPAPEGLAVMAVRFEGGAPQFQLTYGDLKRIQQNDGVLDAAAGMQTTKFGGSTDQFDYDTGEFSVRLIGARVSSSYFDLLGVRPEQGQTFTERTVADGGSHDVVLSHALWRDVFRGQASVIGTLVTLGKQPYRVVGVMPPAFTGIEVETVDLWIPWVRAADERVASSQVCCMAVVKLKPSVSAAVVSERLSQGMKQRRLVAVPLREHIFGARLNLMRLLAIAAALVLVLAGVALVHGQVAHGLAAGPDLAVLHACGASPRQVWITIALEELLVAVAAAPSLFAVAWVMVRAIGPLVAPAATSVPVGDVAQMAVVVGLMASIVTGCLTATVLSRRLDLSTLVTKRSTTASRRARRWGMGLSFSVAMAVTVMLTLTNSVVQNALRVNRFSLGVDGRDVVVAGLRLGFDRYKAPDVARFETRALTALSRIPGVTQATVASGVPILSPGRTRVVGDGVAQRTTFVEYRVDPRYFELLSIPIVDGRGFAASEPEAVAIVSRDCVGIGAGSPLGTTLKLPTPTRIVGVAGDVTSHIASTSRCALYLPLHQEITWESRFLLKVPSPRPSLDRDIREAIAAIDPMQPVARIARLESALADATREQEGVAAIVVSLAAVGWLIALVWFNSVLTKMAIERRPEIGLRLAIGATRASVTWHVAWVEIWPLAAGTVAGIAASRPLAQAAQHLVFDLQASTMGVGVAVASAGILIMLVACLVPVWTLTRRPPSTLLRA